MMKVLLFFSLSLISGPVFCVDVIGYSGGSVIIISDLKYYFGNSKYVCKVENRECIEIKMGVEEERFLLYTNNLGDLTLFIRKLNPQDAGTYQVGVGNWKIDVNLKVVNDSCCAGPKITNAFQGHNTSITCNFPVKYEHYYKYIIKLDNERVFKVVLDSPGRQIQDGRFSVSDDRPAKVLNVNISDVKEADDGVYLCGVYNGEGSVWYYSYFTEIHLHVRGSSNVIIISVCISVVLLALIGGFALMIYKIKHKKTQGSTPSSKDNEQVPPDADVYEKINYDKHVSASDTELYMNASSPSNSPDREIVSTVQPPQDQNITYTTVSFQRNPDDYAVSFSKEESATEYATVQHTSCLE